jgi:hypothetical protein
MRFSLLCAAILAVANSRPDGGEAHAAERGGWYIGAGAGRSAFSSPPSTLDTFASIPASGNIDALELRSSVVRAYGGFRVNRYFALEAGYTDLGKVTFAKEEPPCPIFPGTSCPAVVQNATTGEISAYGWNFSARGILPLSEQFELSGKLGLFRSTATLRAARKLVSRPFFESEPQFIPERTTRRTSPLIGVGLNYRVTPEFSFTLDWERVSKVGSADTTGEMSVKFLSVGVKYDF